MILNEETSNKLNFNKVLNSHCDQPIYSILNPIGVKTSDGPKLLERSVYELGACRWGGNKEGMILHGAGEDFVVVLAADKTYSIVSKSNWGTLIEGIAKSYLDDIIYGLGFTTDN